MITLAQASFHPLFIHSFCSIPHSHVPPPCLQANILSWLIWSLLYMSLRSCVCLHIVSRFILLLRVLLQPNGPMCCTPGLFPLLWMPHVHPGCSASLTFKLGGGLPAAEHLCSEPGSHGMRTLSVLCSPAQPPRVPTTCGL